MLDDAIGTLYRQYASLCLSVAYRVTRDHQHAEDAVQDAFLAHSLHPERFDGDRGSMATWLSTLAHRRAVDIVRRQSCRPRVDPDVERTLAARPALTRGPAERAGASVGGRQLRLCLATLSRPHRQVLFYAYYLGFTQSEIATATGLPLGTVKSRTRDALGRLRQMQIVPVG